MNCNKIVKFDDLEKNFQSPEKKKSVIAGSSNPSVIPFSVQIFKPSSPAEMIDQSFSSRNPDFERNLICKC